VGKASDGKRLAIQKKRITEILDTVNLGVGGESQFRLTGLPVKESKEEREGRKGVDFGDFFGKQIAITHRGTEKSISNA